MAPLLLLKATLLLAIALAGARLLQRSAAASLHRFWSVAFAALLALPLLALALPAFYVPVPSRWHGAQAAPDSRLPASPAPTPTTGSPRLAAPESRPPNAAHDARPPVSAALARSRPDTGRIAAAAFIAFWIAGSAACLAALLFSLWRVARLSRSADGVNDPAWAAAAADLSAKLGLRHAPRLLLADVGTPMAGGVWRPIVVLPRSAAAWTPDRLDVVLAHEIAHVAGRDTLRHLAARLAVALYWFHPLAWVAARHAWIAREQACDAAVLALGIRPSVYAQVLLDLADGIPAPPLRLAALPIVERSLLETRLMAILDADVARTPVRRLLVPAAALAVLTISLAAAQPAVRAAALPPHASAALLPAPERALELAPEAPQPTGSACAGRRDSPLSGTMSMGDSNGRRVIRQIGYRDGDRIIQDTLGDLSVCMLADGVGERGSSERPSAWVNSAPHVIMEISRGDKVETLEIDRRGGSPRTIWRVGQTERPFDAAAQHWRDRLVAALDSTWDISTLLGEQSSLRGEISSVRGKASSLRGEISSLHGEVSSMRGRQSSVLGEESSLRGEISSIQGHVSSLRGEISSAQGTISSLNASRYGSDASDRAQIADLIARRNADIARIEREITEYNAAPRIADVERQIRVFDADGKAAAIETEIRGFDLDAKVAAVQKKIEDLDVDGNVGAIERRITALDADRKARQIEDRRDEQIKQLAAAFDAIR